MAQYRLLEGGHIETDPETGKTRTFNKGDVFHSDLDLCKRFNARGMMGKFELIADHRSSPDHPFLSQPAPGETQEEFETRQLRLRAGSGQALQPMQAAPSQENKTPEVTLSSGKVLTPAGIQQKPTQQQKPSSSPRATTAPTKPTGSSLPSTDVADTYNAMTVDELKKYAAEEEIEFGPAARKEDMVKILTDAKAGK